MSPGANGRVRYDQLTPLGRRNAKGLITIFRSTERSQFQPAPNAMRANGRCPRDNAVMASLRLRTVLESRRSAWREHAHIHPTEPVKDCSTDTRPPRRIAGHRCAVLHRCERTGDSRRFHVSAVPSGFLRPDTADPARRRSGPNLVLRTTDRTRQVDEPAGKQHAESPSAVLG